MLSILLMAMIFTSLTSLSPLKLSLVLTSISIFSSFMIYSTSNSMFVPMVCLISFSSGMMILFSYCSMLANHETMNNKTKKLKNLMMSVFMVFLFTPPKHSEPLKKLIMETEKTHILTMMMVIIILVMISINKTFFNPTKKLMQSY